jgi:hypothetical protein
MFLRNIDRHLPDYTESLAKKIVIFIITVLRTSETNIVVLSTYPVHNLGAVGPCS